MAKNKLTDLNNHLFAQLERLSEEDISEDELKKEVSRASSISKVSQAVINNNRLMLDAMKLISNGNIRSENVPETLGVGKSKPQ